MKKRWRKDGEKEKMFEKKSLVALNKCSLHETARGQYAVKPLFDHIKKKKSTTISLLFLN